MYVQRLQQSYVVNGMINTKTLKQHQLTELVKTIPTVIICVIRCPTITQEL